MKTAVLAFETKSEAEAHAKLHKEKSWVFQSVYGLWFLTLLLCSCAQTHKPANVPSIVGVRGQIVDAQQHIQAASAAVKAAGTDNAQIKSLSNAIDDKAVIIDRWLETHP